MFNRLVLLPGRLLVVGWLLLWAGCAAPQQTAEERAQSAKTLFEETGRDYHSPSAAAQGGEQRRLLDQAAAGYERVLRQYPDQEVWAAQALRNLGGVRAAQGRLDEAVRLYRSVAVKYPNQSWEILMAWKSAGDLLWDAGQRDAAKVFYQDLIRRFDQPEAPAMVQTAVRGSKRRLAQSGSESVTP